MRIRGLGIGVGGMVLLIGLAVGLAGLRPAARRPPPTAVARIVWTTTVPTERPATPSPTLSSAPTPEAHRMVVAGTGGLGLRLREGPGLQYAVLAVLPEGTAVWAFPRWAEADGLRWRWVQTEDGGSAGWAAEPYLLPAEP